MVDRIQPLFRLKTLLEQHRDELALSITDECGKTLAESKAEILRAIENVETACAMPMMMQGTNCEDIAPGIDEHMIRQPLGVVAAIVPFNFPGMIAFWFFPYAVAAGNCFLLKPSERVPITSQKIFSLIQAAGFPAGRDAACEWRTRHGKCDSRPSRHQSGELCGIDGDGEIHLQPRGGKWQTRAVPGRRKESGGGDAGRGHGDDDADSGRLRVWLRGTALPGGIRCNNGGRSAALIHGADCRGCEEPQNGLRRRAGRGDGPGDFSAESKARIEGLIAKGEQAGARVLVDGRGRKVEGYEDGFFVLPTVLDDVPPDAETARTEIFGPVLSLIHAQTIEEAIALVNGRSYGNMACIFTTDGANARRFRYEVQAGNVGINVGVAAPMSTFPFSGWGDSFFGDLHAQAHHAVEFFTQTKVVVERWPKEWSRKF